MVLSKSDVTGEISYKRVVNTFIRQTQAIYKVTLEDGTVLETTWNHPFRKLKLDATLLGSLQESTESNQSMDLSEWTEAKELKSGDLTFTADGKLLAISSIEVDGREETVYNFEVEDFHTYFVGESGIWVHNDDYGGKHGKDRYLTDAHQIDYTNANLTEEELRKAGKLNPELKNEIKEKLQKQLEERGDDYIEDQVSDFIKENCGSNSTSCPEADEFRNKLRGEVSEHIKGKLDQFDSPTVGYDFFNNAPVKAIGVKSKSDLNDVTQEVNNNVALAQSKLLNTEYGFLNLTLNGIMGSYNKLFNQGGELDFKNNKNIMGENAKLDGYQGYVVYQDKILQQSDLGNMAFGHIMNQNANLRLGMPNDNAIYYKSPASSVFSIGHDRQVADHEEYDRVRDQKAMVQGYNCGMDVSKNCVPSNLNFGPPKYNESSGGRVIRQYFTPRNQGINPR